MLKFSPANAKIKNLEHLGKVFSFDLPAGQTCPFADKCKSEVVVIDGKRKIQDGPNCEFRCFSASQEVLFTNVYLARKHNYDLLREHDDNFDDLVELIDRSLPSNAGVVRIHVSGDFYRHSYFAAWLEVARRHPKVVFYAYTKSIRYWIANQSAIPANFVLTASRGGKDDDLISQHNLRNVTVVYSELQAGDLPIDHTDEYAADPHKRHINFALLLHGTQPAGTPAGEALKQLRKSGTKHSYSRKD